MPLKPSVCKYLILLAAVCVFALAGYIYSEPLFKYITQYYYLLTDKEKIESFITSFGIGAPVAFIIVQILQVLFAPVPGEAGGFIGGYLFGITPGFIYSSIGLTIGSWINFLIGRFLGEHYVRKLIPAKQLNRFDTIIKHQGVIAVFILFVFPGFPKDALCFFLGFSTIPIKLFIILASIGRMPGTFMLSLQGALLLEQSYEMFALILGICIILIFIAFRYKENLYRWIEKFNGTDKL
ncbi:MAG: VTT domain-containing protein [Proteobacteria bacterium]|nr:VTT domain-containing protein [Pseudomonadota bacterium]MBU4287179.1 VTT domain-containing protein [Pseudomonadota bacterium]MBU4414492.1 VTT domain-containing protein [Pseudomonadota bacterium]MCG2758230.1 VTT domain-containing protein [Desulfobacteraceae bacterium]